MPAELTELGIDETDQRRKYDFSVLKSKSERSNFEFSLPEWKYPATRRKIARS